MNDRRRQEILALAALFLAVSEVRALATRGQCDMDNVAVCFAGLLRPYQGDVAATYGGPRALAAGLHRLQSQLANPQDMEQTRHVIMAVTLERRLIKRRDMLETLAQGLDVARHQAEHFGDTHENVIARLAELYSQTVSRLRPRIMVQGRREWLDDPRNANIIRALLLSGVRAATLWRDCGGNRLRLIFGRNGLVSLTGEVLRELEEGPSGAD